MNYKSISKGALRSALMAGVAVSSLAAFESAAVAQDGVTTILITGSRIAKRDYVSNSPIQTVDAEVFKQTSAITVEHLLNTMPQVVAGISSQSNNPSSNGRAFIDLRGLGAGRNLVLMDGRRPMGSTSGGTVDVNTIPAALIERVEIITGGASAVYGPDAISGVVNFIMKKDFEGLAVSGNYSISEQGDARELTTDATLGSTFADGKGHGVFNFSYANRDVLSKGARGFSAQADGATSFFPGGNWLPGAVAANQPSQAAVDAIFGAGQCLRTGGTTNWGFNDDGTMFCTGVAGNATFNVVGFNSNPAYIAEAFFPDFFSYNFEPDNNLVLPLERMSFFASFDLEIFSWLKPYATAMFTNYNAEQELAPSPAPTTTNPVPTIVPGTGAGVAFSVPVTNPFIPAQLATLLASRTNAANDFLIRKRFNSLGGRIGTNTHDVWQTTMGSKGDLWGTWGYDAYFSIGRSVFTEKQGGNVRVRQVELLLDSATGGANLCAGGFNWYGNNPLSAECQAFIGVIAKNQTVSEQMIGEAVFSGELFNLPAGPVQSAIGASYRSLDFDFSPDSALLPGEVAGFNGQLPLGGYLDFVDVFAEIEVPILKDLSFVQDFTVTAGYRITENNRSGQSDTWKLDGDWTVNDMWRFRGGYQHAVRSPTIGELFSPQTENFPNIAGQDPCNTSAAGTGATFRNGTSGWGSAAQVTALCAAQAAATATATYNQPFGQAEAITGGNPNLSPEIADTWTVGAIFSSQSTNPWFEQASASVDYWSIEMTEVIAAVGATTIIQRCFNRDNANPSFSLANFYCALFERDPLDGRVRQLQQLQQNQAAINTSGVDVTFNWGFDLGLMPSMQTMFGPEPGSIAFQLTGTWWEKYETQTTAQDPLLDFVGTIGQTTGSATPDYKVTLTTTYTNEVLQLALRTRYIDAMNHATSVTGGLEAGVPATWYLDLSGRYDVTEWVSVRAGINNLLDQEPRIYSPNIQANTDPSTYDVVGRRYTFGIDIKV